MEKKISAALLHLGSNMWRKKDFHDHEYDDEKLNYRHSFYADMDVWHKVTEFMPSCGINTIVIDMGEAVRLDSHPELAVEGSLTKEEFRRELDRLRALGLKPIPKYNFSPAHNAWLQEYAYMVGTEKYNQVCEDIIREAIELFDKPEFFHLGLDEEEPETQKKYTRIIFSRHKKKKLDDVNRLFAVCEEYGVRPWIWVDIEFIKSLGGDEEFCNGIPKSVLISNWYSYQFFKIYENVELYKKLGEWGYDQVPCVTTMNYHLNVKETMKYCGENVAPELIKGYITAPWLLTTQKNIYGIYNDLFVFGNAKKEFGIE